MADAKRWKIHEPNGSGPMVASCRDAYDAARLVAWGSTGPRVVKRAGRIVYRWPEDRENADPFESYDETAALMVERHQAHMRERIERRRS